MPIGETISHPKPSGNCLRSSVVRKFRQTSGGRECARRQGGVPSRSRTGSAPSRDRKPIRRSGWGDIRQWAKAGPRLAASTLRPGGVLSGASSPSRPSARGPAGICAAMPFHPRNPQPALPRETRRNPHSPARSQRLRAMDPRRACSTREARAARLEVLAKGRPGAGRAGSLDRSGNATRELDRIWRRRPAHPTFVAPFRSASTLCVRLRLSTAWRMQPCRDAAPRGGRGSGVGNARSTETPEGVIGMAV